MELKARENNLFKMYLNNGRTMSIYIYIKLSISAYFTATPIKLETIDDTYYD